MFHCEVVSGVEKLQISKESRVVAQCVKPLFVLPESQIEVLNTVPSALIMATAKTAHLTSWPLATRWRSGWSF